MKKTVEKYTRQGERRTFEEKKDMLRRQQKSIQVTEKERQMKRKSIH